MTAMNSNYCEDLQGLQLVDVSPSSVPQATFVRLPNETCFNHELYAHTNMTAVSNINDINRLQGFSKQLDLFISKFYTRRSIMAPVQKYLRDHPANPAVANKIAIAQAQPLVELLRNTIQTVIDSGKAIATIIQNAQQWNTGAYSEELLSNICRTIYRLFVLDKLHQAKRSIKADITGLAQLSGSGANVLNQNINSFLNNPDVIEKSLFEALRPTQSDILQKVTGIFYNYIKVELQNENSVIAEHKYVLMISLAFFMKLCPLAIPPTELPAIKTVFETCPYIPLIHEYSMNIISYLQPLDIFKNHGITLTPQPIDLTRVIKTLRAKFSDVSTKLHHETSSLQNAADLESSQAVIAAVIEAIKLIATTTNALRELYAAKLDKPPAEPKDMKPYERAVRAGYSQLELKAMLQLIALCRELNDLIRTNTPSLYPKMCTAVHQTFQEFIKNILEKTAVRAKRKKKSMKNVIDQVRAVAGDYFASENSQIIAKKSSDLKGKRHEIPLRFSPPSPQLIELVRIQIQHMITNEASFLQPSKKLLKSKVAFHETDLKRLQTFVADSANWVALISFEQTLSEAADQSCFYFKEVQLDMNSAVQFPAKSSLPFILCQFALDNYVQPELTEIIFYPLSIYDDAASVAASKHHSRLMLDEIKAEARVCLDTLSNLIGEFTFNAYRTFATLRQLPDKVISHLKKTHARHWPHSQAYRLRTLLQQNQYYLLSKQIALKSLIAPRVAEELNNSVAQLYKLAQDLGIVASLAISRVLNIIRETHRLLMEQGLSLMPFKDVERTAKWDNMLQGFSSKYLNDVTQTLFRNVVRNYSLSINPLRLMPAKKLQLPADSLGKLTLGRILKDALDSTVAFITVHHFNVMIRQISDGSVVYLATKLQDSIQKAFASFLEKYRNVSVRLTRIKDAPFGTSAHTAFTRYEAAYKFFLNDNGISSLLKDMQTLGNLFIVAELIDEALSMKEFNVVQIMSYLRSVDENNTPRDEIEKLFDAEFRDAIKIVTARPMTVAENSQQLMMAMSMKAFASLIQQNNKDFEEPNPRLQDFTQMQGFACTWSVVEFVYCLTESIRVGDAASGFSKHGQGVMVCAAIILLITGQTDLNRLLGIGRKMQRHHETDMSGMADEKTLRFLAVSQYDTATVDWALMFFQPFVQNFTY
ncbi:hypothetical protein TRFO_12163 [Tritrichomonas foetus]|uniref:CYRIA/CYRIB Rac1 binding domain-containing protein n=1 Tax=Tritrichomonas foetus TaxID=1144522 RepID=A0A1J4IZZ1_9EUKA|nr:hypothetical protein TRFO_12163 [Tritrichomonas foetus]|eukprot:OHS92974.1 hypothetical protein TRFO_12163 [Tritrichomonas foetus]